MMIFLNSSRLFMDFRKIEYAMSCNTSYARLVLEGFSYAWQIYLQPICTSILAKFYSWKMRVLKNGGVVDISAMDTYSEMDLCTLILLGEARKKNWMANHF
jgi:hypothetical protein